MLPNASDRLFAGLMWTMMAVLFAMVLTLIFSPDTWVSWDSFLLWVLIGYVGAPAVIVVVYLIGAVAEVALEFLGEVVA